jgi:hypothetical protein
MWKYLETSWDDLEMKISQNILKDFKALESIWDMLIFFQSKILSIQATVCNVPVYSFWRRYFLILRFSHDHFRNPSTVPKVHTYIYIFRVMIDWHHALIRWHHSLDTLTLASHIRKESFVKQKSLHLLHARCTRNALEVLQPTDFVELLDWSSAFDLYKYDSKRAIFDVDYQVWNASFLKLF